MSTSELPKGPWGEGNGSRAFLCSQSLRQACGYKGQGEPKREAGRRGCHFSYGVTALPSRPWLQLLTRVHRSHRQALCRGAWVPRAGLKRGSLHTLTLAGPQRMAPGVGGLQAVCATGGVLYRHVRVHPSLLPL